MKKACLFFILSMPIIPTYGDTCTVSSTTYSCAAGYYLDGTTCKQCPTSGGVTGTSPDKNTGGRTSCYATTTSTYTDTSGTFKFTSNCYYKE